MRYIFLTFSAFLSLLMLILFFQNFSASYDTYFYFLLNETNLSPAFSMLISYLLGLFSAGFLALFFIGGNWNSEDREIFDESTHEKDEW